MSFHCWGGLRGNASYSICWAVDWWVRLFNRSLLSSFKKVVYFNRCLGRGGVVYHRVLKLSPIDSRNVWQIMVFNHELHIYVLAFLIVFLLNSLTHNFKLLLITNMRLHTFQKQIHFFLLLVTHLYFNCLSHKLCIFLFLYHPQF